MKRSSAGAAVHVRELEKGLKQCGHSVKVYYLNRFTSVEESVRSRLRSFLKKKLGRYLNQINGLLANGRYFVKEWKILSLERPEVVLVRYNLLNFSLPIVSFIRKVPFLLEVNAPMAYESRKFARQVIQLPFIPEVLERLNLVLANKVIVVSQELKDYYLNWHIPSEKIVVVPNGVDERKFHPEISSEAIRSRYELKNKIVIGFIGTFHYWHGLDNLLQLIEITLSRFNNTAFLLVGDGPLKKDLEEKLKQRRYSDRVVFSGYVSHDEIPEYLNAMDIVLLTYPKLDFFYYSPLKLFEYMAEGKAVLASRIGQIEKVIRDGVNGMLFEPENIDELKEKLFLLITKNYLRRKLGRNARKTILEQFTWYHSASKISQAIKTIVE